LKEKEVIMEKRDFLKTSALAAGGVLAAPAIHAQQTIKWRFQTYAGAALGEHVTKPIIDSINRAAEGRCRSTSIMPISLFRQASCSGPCR
jgi:hypothetical protein